MNYHDAHSELCTLTGIGPKVADCICLMSLDHLSSIPVDVHVIHLAKVYLPELNLKTSLTKVNYKVHISEIPKPTMIQIFFSLIRKSVTNSAKYMEKSAVGLKQFSSVQT